jgi:hypothetical protein
VDVPKGLPPLVVPGAAKRATAQRSETSPTTSSATALSAAAAPAPSAAAPGTPASVNYFYAIGDFNAVREEQEPADGASAVMTIGKPALDRRDRHSLAEVAVQSVGEDGKPDGKNVIEVGWTVDRQINEKNPDEPHLFVYRWLNGDPTDGHGKNCYNNTDCGFVPVGSAAIGAGGTLTAGQTKKFGIQHFGNSWWIWYDKGWIGRYPDSVWGGTFTEAAQVYWFGEVAAGGVTPCSEMGTGRSATSSGAALFYSIRMLTNGLTKNDDTISTPTEVPVRTWPLGQTYYDIYKPSPPPPAPDGTPPPVINYFYYGGKGGDCS